MTDRSLGFVLALVLAAGCGDENGGGDGGMDGGRETLPDGRVIGCASAAECRGGEVCDPSTHECVASLSCTAHDDCGGAAFCNGGTCAPNSTGGPCSSDANCPPGEQCIGDVCGCDGESYGAESVPPNMLIVLDRSNSMNESIGDGTKWEVALEAIDGMLTTYGERVRFGLMLYPGTNESCSEGMDCGPGAVFVDPADGTAAAIRAVLDGAGTCMFATPTAEALDVLLDYDGLRDPSRPNHVLLITDGQSTCEDPVDVVTMLRGLTPEVRTFAIGFGEGANPDELNAIAEEGGTARDGDPSYYQADSSDDLMGAFASIAGSVLSCTYTLSDVPEDLSQLYVYFDRTLVARDTTQSNGWNYDPAATQLTFYGADCDRLRSGGVASLVIVYGCPIF
jgi:hypothetical protein